MRHSPSRVFICYNAADGDSVLSIVEGLKARGVDVWFDQYEIVPGSNILDAVDTGLRACSSIAVFVGRMGTGPWQTEEIGAALNSAITEGKPLIPVALPGATSRTAKLPALIKGKKFIEFLSLEDEEAMANLVWGVTGLRPTKMGVGAPPAPVGGFPFEKESKGHDLTLFGHTQGKLSLKADMPELEPGREEYLLEAVEACLAAYRLLQNHGGPSEFLALNNFLFYASILVASGAKPVPHGEELSRTWLLDKARALLLAVEEHQDDTPRAVPLMLTFCCVVNLFGRKRSDLQTALELATAVHDRSDVSSSQRREADYYRAQISRKIRPQG